MASTKSNGKATGQSNDQNGTSSYWDSLATQIHQGIVTLCHEDFCTDFEIIAGGKSFRCHKVVLASVSDYFKAMFSSGMTETEQNKAVFDDISSDSFQTIFMILYPQEPVKERKDPLRNKSEEDVLELLKLAARFQMNFLKHLCLENLETNITCENCISLWKYGEVIQCVELSEMGRDFVRESFDELVSMQALDSLEYNDFLIIIQDKDMHVKNEEVIWVALRNWIKFDEKQRSQYISELMKECCLTQIETRFLLEEILFDSLVRHNDEASKVVQDVVEYSYHPSLHNNLELKFRECHEKQQVTVILYNIITGHEQVDDFDGFNFVGNKEKLRGKAISNDRSTCRSMTCSKPITHSGKGFWNISCCVYGQSMYVLNENSLNESELLEFDGVANKWYAKRPLNQPLIGHTMCALDGCLFVFGGRHKYQMNAQVWKYYIDSDSWLEGGEIIAPVVNASSVAYKKKIYIFGGTIDRHEPATCIQVYDSVTEIGTIFSNLPKPCSFSRALVRGSTAYIVTSDGDVEKVCLDTAEASIIASVPLKYRQTFGINMRSDILTVFIGQGSKKISEVASLKEKKGQASSLLSSALDETDVKEFDDDDDDDDNDDDDITMKDIFIDVNSGDVEVSQSFLQDCNILGCVSLVVNSSSL